MSSRCICIALFTLSAIALGCGPGERVAIDTTREVDPAEYAGAKDMSTAERFGYEPRANTPAPQTPAAGEEAAAGFAWDAPDAWQRQPDRAMRLATYTHGTCECYITTLAGPAGGVAANINRWRRQMGQPPLSEEELAALPRLDVLGRAAPFVTIAGAYTGMSGEERPDSLMFGMVCPLDDETLFVKMLGPEAEMRAETGRFTAFCESLRRE